MAIKAGQILHDANGFVIDRIQTGGVSNLNIPKEKINELGNFNAVATIRDIPDLGFDVESLDVSTEMEALVTGLDPTTVTTGQEIDFQDAVPISVISPFKAATNNFDIVKGVIVPYLTLESVQYRFGVRQNSTQSFGFKGDSVYYVPGSPYSERFNVSPGANQVYTLDNTAIAYTEAGDTIYALSVCAYGAGNKYKRLFIGSDFTNTNGAVTVLADLDADGYDEIEITYGSTTQAEYLQTVHQGTSVKPAAVRGKDIDVYISDGAATPTLIRWNGVQSFDVQRRVNLDAEDEFGNYHYVAQDYDTADVTGSITLRPNNPDDLFDKIAQVANVSPNVVAGPHSSTPLQMELRISDPDTGTRLKTLYIPDARFTVPNIQGRVQQKLQVTFQFESDGGILKVFKGAR